MILIPFRNMMQSLPFIFAVDSPEISFCMDRTFTFVSSEKYTSSIVCVVSFWAFLNVTCPIWVAVIGDPDVPV